MCVRMAGLSRDFQAGADALDHAPAVLGFGIIIVHYRRFWKWARVSETQLCRRNHEGPRAFWCSATFAVAATAGCWYKPAQRETSA